MNRISLTLGLAALIGGTALAAPITFKVGAGTRAQQLATFESDTDFENIVGRSDNVVGQLTFDPVAKTGGGTLKIRVDTLETGIALRDEHLRGETWLNSAKFPEIVFESTKVRSLGNDRYEVSGKFTLKGVTKTIKTIAVVKYRKGTPESAKIGFKGDVLQVKTSFEIKLSDFGVQIPEFTKSKVSNTIKINVVAYGQSG